MPLHTRILIGLGVGAGLGLAANSALGGDHAAVAFLNDYLAGPAGQIFLRLLFMVVIPLVFASITLGVAGLGDLRLVGRIGAKSLLAFLASTAAASILGLLLVSVLRPGDAIDEALRTELMATYAKDAGAKVEAAAKASLGVDLLINLVPRNPFKAAVDLDLLGVITFSLIFGAALTLLPAERARPMVQVLEALGDVTTKIVAMAMGLAPYGVAGLIFGVTSRFGFDVLLALGAYVLIVIFGLLFHALVTLSIALRLLVGVSPTAFLTRARSALVTAFSTSSSNATLPTNIAVAELNLGLPPKVAGFVLPLGATMNMNGTALFEGVTVLFLCQVFGVDLSVGQMVVVMGMAVVTAVGAAGVPGGSIPLMVGLLVTFGVPGEGIAIILGVDRLLDMCRTTVNVYGDLVSAAWVARNEGQWSAADMPTDEALDRAARDESPSPPP